MIRAATLEDARAILSIYGPYCLSTIVSFELEPPPLEEMEKRIATTLSRGMPWLVFEQNQTVAGYAYAGPHKERAAYRFSAEASVYLSDTFHRQGIASRLYKQLFTELRQKNFYNVLAGISLPNPASVSFHESQGFQPVGIYRKIGYKFGSWHDVGWWQLALQDHNNLPPE